MGERGKPWGMPESVKNRGDEKPGSVRKVDLSVRKEEMKFTIHWGRHLFFRL